MFNKKQILLIQAKIKNQIDLPLTEEATKQRFIIPVIAALGFDPYSSDIEPEYTLDFGVKKGEKVDYALQINNQPVAIIECKLLDHALSKDNVLQLFRYFLVSGVHIAILTNGDDYWFFTDSIKLNIMDSEPYFTIKLLTALDADIDKLEKYSKDNIQNISIAELLQKEAFIKEAKLLLQGLKNNNIPAWLIKAIWDRTKREVPDSDEQVDDILVDKLILAGLLYDEVQRTFKVAKLSGFIDHDIIYDFDDTIQDKQLSRSEIRWNNKQNRLNIRLNHEYVYNDYTDGDWQFHKIGYAIVFGNKLEKTLFGGVLFETVSHLISCGYEEKLMKSVLISSCLSYTRDAKHNKLIEGTNIYVLTLYSSLAIVKIIEQVLKTVGLPDNSIILLLCD